MAKRKLHCSLKTLTLWVEEDSREIFRITCINLVHYWGVRYTIEQVLKGKCKEHYMLKSINMNLREMNKELKDLP